MFTTAKPAMKDIKITDSGLFHADNAPDATPPVGFLDIDWNETANPTNAFQRKSQGMDRCLYYASGKPDTTPGPKNVFLEWKERRRLRTTKPVVPSGSRTLPTGGPRHVDSARGDPRSKPFQFDNRGTTLGRSLMPFTGKAVELERDLRQSARNAAEATVFTQHKQLTTSLRIAIGEAKDNLRQLEQLKFLHSADPESAKARELATATSKALESVLISTNIATPGVSELMQSTIDTTFDKSFNPSSMIKLAEAYKTIAKNR